MDLKRVIVWMSDSFVFHSQFIFRSFTRQLDKKSVRTCEASWSRSAVCSQPVVHVGLGLPRNPKKASRVVGWKRKFTKWNSTEFLVRRRKDTTQMVHTTPWYKDLWWYEDIHKRGVKKIKKCEGYNQITALSRYLKQILWNSIQKSYHNEQDCFQALLWIKEELSPL